MHKSQFSHDISSSASHIATSPPSSLSTSAPTGSRLHLPRFSNRASRHSPSSSLNNPLPPVILPRTSSLLPPPEIVPSSHTKSQFSSQGPSPIVSQGNRPQTPPRSSTIATTSPTKGNTESIWNLNRWSASTGSSRASILTHRGPGSRFGRRASSIDATAALTGSPPSAKQSPRKLQKTRRLSNSTVYKTENFSTPVLPWESTHPALGLPPGNPQPPSDYPPPSNYSHNRPEGTGPSSMERRQPSATRYPSQSQMYPGGEGFANQSTPSLVYATSRAAMQYDQSPEAHQPRGHARSRSGKGSNELKGRNSKPLSQKAMLSRALQKANTAVQLDNAQNFVGAREAYAEACHLLQQVLQRTTGDDDQRKLEAIRRTYTSRIDELDQMAPWQEEEETKALPARPDSDIHRPDSILRFDDDDDIEGMAVIETATVTKIIREDSRSPQPPKFDPYLQHHDPYQQQRPEMEHRRESSQDKLRPIVTTTLTYPEHGLLQSSFSRSPIRLRVSDNLSPPRSGSAFMPAPLSPRRPLSPVKPQVNDYDDPIREDFSLYTGQPLEPQEPANHIREESLNSWLDPIDESGGSTASSVHSRTSSLGIRRKHIRAPSGETEAEFDTALDAAIEAAYDEGYEPMDPHEFEPMEPSEEIIANALRKVEIAREHVRQTEREAQEMVREYERQQETQYPPMSPNMPDFYDDNSSDEEEERILEQMTRDLAIEQFTMEPAQKPSIPRESDSSGLTSRTWHSSTGSNPPTATTSLSTVTETPPHALISKDSGPAAPPPTQSLPDLPPTRPGSSAQTVRNRRLSGQNPKQLKIETTKLVTTLPNHREDPMQSKSAISNGQEMDVASASAPQTTGGIRRPSSSHLEISPTDTRTQTPAFGSLSAVEGDVNPAIRSASQPTARLRKNMSSSSLRSMKSRNMSVSNLEEGLEMSPGTPSSHYLGGVRTPAVPAIPTPITAALREKMDTSGGGLHLFDDSILSPNLPGSPNPISVDAPVPLEPCPTDVMLRPFWLMRCLYQTLAHPRGGYLSTKLFVPRDVWRVKGVKLKNIEDKVANCDFLTAALLKIAKVDTCDADAVLEEMQSLEGILEQVQAALTRKLGSEVGVHGSGVLFKEATSAVDENGGSSVPRSGSVTQKSSFSWRRLRSKNSAVGLGGSYTHRTGSHDASKDTPNLPTLPMTPNPTSRPAKRDVSAVQFTGPNAMYMNSLARLFDAAQTIDQIARQVEDPGLRHADKTQVGLELCTRHAAEFFGFYVCRFVLADLGTLLDKFIKRGSEWVLT